LSTRLKVACVSFLNALPYVTGLRSLDGEERPELLLQPPFPCSESLRRDEVDLALVPSIELARVEGAIPAGSFGIASLREVKSVILLSRAPLRTVRSIAVDANSRTSVAHLRILLARIHRNRPELIPMPPDARPMLDRCDAALLIGDAALTAPRNGAEVYDLASMWNEATGMPFVFAVWAARRVAAAKEGGRLLDRALASGSQALRSAAEEAAGRAGLSAAEILEYLTRNIHYRLGSREKRSLGYFISLCREEGLLDPPARPTVPGRAARRNAPGP
jgi:chorismate dehydratase